MAAKESKSLILILNSHFEVKCLCTVNTAYNQKPTGPSGPCQCRNRYIHISEKIYPSLFPGNVVNESMTTAHNFGLELICGRV